MIQGLGLPIVIARVHTHGYTYLHVYVRMYAHVYTSMCTYVRMYAHVDNLIEVSLHA